MTTPKVSVIIPVYNVEAYLEECLESVLAQTLKDIEVIVIDDGSTDSCPQIIDRFAGQDNRIKAVHKQNEGYGKSCNRGFDMARGEYVAILESDDLVDPQMYERLYDYARQLDADVVKGPFRNYYSKDSSEPYVLNDYLSQNMPAGKLYSLLSCPCQLVAHQSIWAGIYRREYLDRYKIRFLEVPGAGNVDIGFCVDSLIHSERLAWLDEAFYSYRVLREGSSTSNFNLPLNIARYREVHEMLKDFPEVRAAVAPYQAAREAGGLYRHFKRVPSYTEKDLLDAHDLFCDYTREELERMPAIEDSMRNEVILLHDDVDASRRLIERQRAAKANKGSDVKRRSLAGRLIRKIGRKVLFLARKSK